MSTSQKKRQNNIKDKTTKEKLSFFAVMLITVGSCIGAGIFFKNATILNNTGSVVMTIVSWLIAIVGILAIALTLTDLVTGSKDHNSLGIIGWIRAFCGDYIYKGFRNFMMFVYLPTNFFFMPYYAVMSIQDAFNIFYPGTAVIPVWAVIGLSALIMIYFCVTCSLSTRASNVQNLVITFVKFIPLAFAVIAGVWIFANNNGHAPTPEPSPTPPAPKQFYEYCPAVLGVIASIPAIFFAFDGFYSASASQHKMHEPKRASSAMALGIAIVSAIYVLISISLLLGTSDGSFFGLNIGGNQLWWKILMFAMLIFIAFAVFGVVNGFAIYGSDFFNDLIKRNEAPLSVWYKNKFANKNKIGTMIYTLTIYSISFAIFTVIGSFYFSNGPYGDSPYYGATVIKIYNFCDLISNWTSLIVFVGLGAAIFGCLIKKYKNKLGHKTTIWFTPMAIIGIALICISILYEFTANFFDLQSSITFTISNKESITNYVIPSILQTVLLLGFTSVIAFSGLNKKQLK